MPHMTCTACKRKYRIGKTGIYLVTMFMDPPQPYEVWCADLWQCPDCGQQTAAGFGDMPILQHWQKGFDDQLQALKDNPTASVYLEYER